MCVVTEESAVFHGWESEPLDSITDRKCRHQPHEHCPLRPYVLHGIMH